MTRMELAIATAQEAFWESIAKSFPEITTGDFAPDAQQTFNEACKTAVETWVEGNTP